MSNNIPNIPPKTPRPPLTERLYQLVAELRESQANAAKALAYHEQRLIEKPRSSVIRSHIRMSHDRHDVLREVADAIEAALRDE